MSRQISVLGIDPSLRNTGFAVVTYDITNGVFLPPERCQIITNPASFKGTNAILNMLEAIKEVADSGIYKDVDQVIVESPAALFNPKFPAGALISIAHISGGACCLFGIDKTFLVRPVEWNRNRRKEKSIAATQETLGLKDTWLSTKKIKSEKHWEHIIDAAGMATWWLKAFHLETEDLPPVEDEE